jgi:hypothetical protein
VSRAGLPLPGPAFPSGADDHAPHAGDAMMPRRTAGFLLLAYLLAAIVGCGDSPPRPPAASAAPDPIGPRGATATPIVFSWKPATGQASPLYRVRVADAAERVLFEQDVRGTECVPSGELLEMMADHATYTWTVGVLSADGATVVVRSKPVGFSLR